jgi:hypothetical protein
MICEVATAKSQILKRNLIAPTISKILLIMEDEKPTQLEASGTW